MNLFVYVWSYSYFSADLGFSFIIFREATFLGGPLVTIHYIDVSTHLRVDFQTITLEKPFYQIDFKRGMDHHNSQTVFEIQACVFVVWLLCNPPFDTFWPFLFYPKTVFLPVSYFLFRSAVPCSGRAKALSSACWGQPVPLCKETLRAVHGNHATAAVTWSAPSQSDASIEDFMQYIPTHPREEFDVV